MKRSPSDHQISTSFKRVKISTSPGELRLHRDLQLLVSSHSHHHPWTPSQNTPPNHCHGYNGSSSRSNSSSSLHELTRNNATIQRDPVNPLRLRLIVTYNNYCHNTHTPERWTFCLEMPRMYPHLPPNVNRVWRENLWSSSGHRVDGRDYGGYNGGGITSYSNNHASSLMVANSMMQRGEAPVPEKVVVKCLPPGGSDASLTCGFGKKDKKEEEEESLLCELDADTAVYREWSPISSLGDLIDFLIDIPQQRRIWWSDEGKRRRHLQSVMMMTSSSSSSVTNHWMHSNAAVRMCPTPQPTRMSQFSTMMVTSSPQKCQIMGQQQIHMQAQQQQYPSSPCDMEEDSLEAAAIEGSPFIANRFDVGYERGSMMRHHWGVR